MNGISINGLITRISGQALVISRSDETVFFIKEILAASGVTIRLAQTEQQAFSHLDDHNISYILIESGISEAPCNKFIRALRVKIGDKHIPILILASTEDEGQLSYCMSAGCDDILYKPFTALSLNNKILSLKKNSELKKLYKASLNEQVVARRILTNAIDERCVKFDEIDLFARSKAIFSGDLFITSRHPDGSVNILLADFTGHGLPSAIGALPVADVFSAMTDKGFELGYILENINNRLHTLLPTNMFMACSVVNISNDLKQVKVWNGGMPDIYIRSCSTGNIKYKIQSSDVPLGITQTVSNQYSLQTIEITPGDQLILFTDGLTESLDKGDDMFGEHRLEKCIQKNTKEKSIFKTLINTFDEFRGDIEPMDDITFACIPCTSKLMYANNVDISKKIHIACSQDDRWHWYMKLAGSSLREINPVRNVIDEIHKISGRSASIDKLSKIMSALYRNVIEQERADYNLQLNNTHKNTKNCSDSTDIYIKIGIKKIYHNGIPALLIHMEDSGKDFSHDALLKSLCDIQGEIIDSNEDEFPLVYELNKLSRKNRSGNRLEAIIFEQSRMVKNYG